MAKGLCVGTHPSNGKHNFPPIDPGLFTDANCIAQCDADLVLYLGEVCLTDSLAQITV